MSTIDQILQVNPYDSGNLPNDVVDCDKEYELVPYKAE